MTGPTDPPHPHDPTPPPPQARDFHADFRPPLDIGWVVSTTLGIWWRNAPKLLVLALLVALPMIGQTLYLIWMPASDTNRLIHDEAAFVWLPIVTVGVMLLILALIAGAIVLGVFDQMSGRPFRLVAGLKVAAARTFPLIIAGLVAYLLIAIGTFLLVVPGIIAMLALYVLISVVVVERCGLFEAVQRSFELTRGYRLAILGVTVALGVVGFLVGILINVLQIAMPVDPIGMGVWLSVSAVLQYLVSLLQLIATAVVYSRLRELKEGTDLDELVSVFA